MAQLAKYWVYFKDKPLAASYQPEKGLSPAALEKRRTLGISCWQWSDVPVSQEYLQALTAVGAKVEVVSKWLNAASCRADPLTLSRIQQLPFVEKITPLAYVLQQARLAQQQDKREYTLAFRQLKADAFIEHNLTGKGILIGVIDAGFYRAPSHEYLKHLFEQSRILGFRDIVSPHRQTDFFYFSETDDDDHGTLVLQMIAGWSPSKKRQYGLATEAKFYLARTDHGDKEFRAEEDYWIAAVEWMDSLGVRIINTSLGYAQDFDNPEDNYKPEQMDGKTTAISKAARIAVEEKGLLLVVAAGNEGGTTNWRIVCAPADVEGVLSVGATTPEGLKTFYSSIGPSFLPYLKPDVSCIPQVSAGTSFSAPLITGFAACLMQAAPEKTAKEIIQIIKKSSHLYPLGNNFIGYGVPDAKRALSLLQGDSATCPISKQVVSNKSTYLIPAKASSKQIAIAFHKSDARNVIEQEVIESTKNGFLVRRNGNAVRTTVVIDNQVVEIHWE